MDTDELACARDGVAVVLVGLHLARSPSPPATDPLQTAAVVGETTLPIRETMIGEEARDGQLVFAVQDFACSPKSTPGQLCQLHFTVKNVSGGPAMFLGKFQYLVDDHHKVYGADSALTAAVPDNSGRNVDQLNVNPDVVMPLVLVYDLPDTMTPTEAQFKGTGGSRFGVNVRLERRG